VDLLSELRQQPGWPGAALRRLRRWRVVHPPLAELCAEANRESANCTQSKTPSATIISYDQYAPRTSKGCCKESKG
jgi:hypothetical protein